MTDNLDLTKYIKLKDNGYFKHLRKLTDQEKECQDEKGKADKEKHIKEMGVWKQKKYWYLNTYYNPNDNENDFFLDFDRYYSLAEVKKAAIKKCEDESVLEKLFQYDGNDTFKQGNIKIKCVTDDDDFD